MPAARSVTPHYSPEPRSPSARDSVVEQMEQIVETIQPESRQVKDTIHNAPSVPQPVRQMPRVRARPSQEIYSVHHSPQNPRIPTGPRKATPCHRPRDPAPSFHKSGPVVAPVISSFEAKPTPLQTRIPIGPRQATPCQRLRGPAPSFPHKSRPVDTPAVYSFEAEPWPLQNRTLTGPPQAALSYRPQDSAPPFPHRPQPQDTPAVSSFEPRPWRLSTSGPPNKGARRNNTPQRGSGWPTKADFATLEKEYAVSTWGSAASQASRERRRGVFHSESDNGRGLRGWNGSLAPPPVDRNPRLPFIDQKLSGTIRDWMLAVDEAMEDIAQYNPISTRLYLGGQIWNFVKSDDVNEQGVVMGDIIPDYWIPTSVDGKAPLIFVRNLQVRNISPLLRDHFRDCDADDKGDKLWWDHRVQGGYFLPDNMRPPTIIGPDPDESSTDVVARINDFGSNKSAKNWLRAKVRREKALRDPLRLEDLHHHEPTTDVVARNVGRDKHIAPSEGRNTRRGTQFEDLLEPVQSSHRESSRFVSPDVNARKNAVGRDNQAANLNRDNDRRTITFEDLLGQDGPSHRKPITSVILGEDHVGKDEQAANKKKKKKGRKDRLEKVAEKLSEQEQAGHCETLGNGWTVVPPPFEAEATEDKGRDDVKW